jgi:S-formylglutathione hydrolase FrmB
MTARDRAAKRGSVQRLSLDSKVLQRNLLGDPTRREIAVYLPDGHDGRNLPLLVDLVGFTSGGPAHVNWKAFGENLPERLDRLIAAKAMQPVVVAMPDCFTRLGGNQYINSTAMGRWEDFLIDEAVPLVEKRFGCGGPGRRGVFGKSSGGYGALVHGMRRPDFWSAAACHSGDMGFDICYFLEFPGLLRVLAKHDHSIEKFVTSLETAKKRTGADMHALMMLAMAATYDPAPDQFLGIRLPVDLMTCELIEERWNNWLAWDPLRLAETHGDNLKRLTALYVDCGAIDQYNLVFGARKLHRTLDRLGVRHRYDEFPDNHSDVDYRMDESLPFLAKALA